MIFLNRISSTAIFQSQLKSRLFLPEEQSCRYYSNLSMSLLELFQGTIQFMAHKKSIIITKGTSEAHEFLLAQFYREALNLQWLEGFAEPSEEWMNQLKKDTSIALIYEDHPITGEIYPWQKIDNFLNEKKIFSLRISYFSHRLSEQGENSLEEVKPYSLRLCVGPQGDVLAKLGSRFKVPPVFSQNMEMKNPIDILAAFSVRRECNPSLVLDFEESAKRLSATTWTSLGKRSFDRSILIFAKLNADFLKKTIEKKLPELSSEIDTLVDCSSGFSRPLSTWWSQGPQPEQQRSMILFSLQALKSPGLVLALQEACQEAQNHSWEF